MAPTMLLSLLALTGLTTATPLLHPRNASCPASATSNPGPGYEHHTVGQKNGSWPWQIYKSSSLTPPVWEINRTGDPLASGYIVTTVIGKSPAAQIFTDEGQLVWSSEPGIFFDLKVATLFGRDVLVYATARELGNLRLNAESYGTITILDDTYSTLTSVCPWFDLNVPGNKSLACQADPHESYVTDKGTLLVPSLNLTTADLSPIGGAKNACVSDPVMFELDIQSGEVLFSWSALDHVPITASQRPGLAQSNCSSPVDWFHMNSLQNVGDYYLVSGRYTNTVFYISPTGEIIWELNGQSDGGNFSLAPEPEIFKFQHDARVSNVQGDSFDLSLFNNNEADEDIDADPTELILFSISGSSLSNSSRTTNRTAVLQRQIVTDPPVYVESMGSYQPNLANGHQLGTYGVVPLIKEFGPTQNNQTKELWSGRCGHDKMVDLYRGYKQEWHATPWDLPSLVIEANSTTGAYNGYVSWNGATDVTGWNVYVSGGSQDDMQKAGAVPFRGFETMFHVPCWATYVQVGAQEAGGEVRRSPVVVVP